MKSIENIFDAKKYIIGNETELLIEAHPSLFDTLCDSPKDTCLTLSDLHVGYFNFTDNSVEATKEALPGISSSRKHGSKYGALQEQSNFIEILKRETKEP